MLSGYIFVAIHNNKHKTMLQRTTTIKKKKIDTPDVYADDIIINIKEQCRIFNTTIQDVMNKCNLHRSNIYRLSKHTSLGKIKLIANAIGCAPSELLKGI